MKSSYLLPILSTFVLIPLFTHAADPQKPTLVPRIESQYRFALNPDVLNAGTPQYFSELIEAPRDPMGSQGFQHIEALDFPRYFDSRGSSRYSVMLGRVAFTVKKPVSFYSRERVLDVKRMNRITPEFPARQTAQGPGYYISDATPGCKFTVETYSREELLALGNSRPELRYAETMHPELGVPDRLVIQHNYDFDRILGFKTSRGAVTLTAHYAQGSDSTLILTYSLAYLENMPPRIWGGAKLVVDTSRDATLVLIERIRKE
jgi:hypothetical protein